MRNIVLIISFMGRGVIDAPIDEVAAYIKNFEFRKDWDKNLQVRPFA